MQIILDNNDFLIKAIEDAYNNTEESIELVFDKDKINFSVILNYLNKMINWEFEKVNQNYEKKLPNIYPLFKNLTFDEKVELLSYLAAEEHVVNSTLLFNLYLFIKSNDGFESDDVFTNPYIFVQSIEEFLDLKIIIKDKLNIMLNNVALYYLAVMSSLHINVEQGLVPGTQPTPLKYSQLITLLSFTELSRIVSKSNSIDMNNIPKVYDAQHIWNILLNKEQPTIELFKSLTDYIKENINAD